jgi:hypothetical protein
MKIVHDLEKKLIGAGWRLAALSFSKDLNKLYASSDLQYYYDDNCY